MVKGVSTCSLVWSHTGFVSCSTSKVRKRMRLTDLDPRWVSYDGEGISDAQHNPILEREKIGMSFLCPCKECVPQRSGDYLKDFHLRVNVTFTNPPDGGPSVGELKTPTWHRTGETFEDMVLRPSILSDKAKGGCGWHGYVGGQSGEAPGEVVTL